MKNLHARGEMAEQKFPPLTRVSALSTANAVAASAADDGCYVLNAADALIFALLCVWRWGLHAWTAVTGSSKGRAGTDR